MSNTNNFMLWFWVIVWYLAWARICVAINSNKGNSKLAGWFGGFLLGPIGAIICACHEANEQRQNEKQLKSGKMKKCPQCAELVKSEARVCRFCNTNLAPMSPPVATPITQSAHASQRLSQSDDVRIDDTDMLLPIK